MLAGPPAAPSEQQLRRMKFLLAAHEEELEVGDLSQQTEITDTRETGKRARPVYPGAPDLFRA